MYLKRLDLYGFKSFAARTAFDFGQGITAIVGPNGSGKSNIADALRWVLGEQSGRLLRARKLDDIIYAGSGKRPRGDKVGVTLTLDNSDGWLPVDAAEVAISRRGARNGDSDYLINGKRVRLRELQAILMRAEVTQNSYAIIGQGLVESVLNLRPEDRRQLIEEAADIQRYRLKIEEAQDRLVSTHENVERVKLLIKEIAPRMAQLERQARRAGEHSQLAKQLAQYLRVFYEESWHGAQESLTVSRASHDQAQAEFTQARVALETCQRDLADVTDRLEERRQTAAAAGAERDRVDQSLRELDRRLAVARERRGILQARGGELQEEIAALERERQRASGVLAVEAEERARLGQAVAAARQAWQARQEELSGLEQEFRETLAHAADAEARSKRLLTAAAELKARLRRLEDTQRDLEREASRLDTRRRSLVNQMAEQLRVLRGLRAQEAQLLAEVAHTSARRQALDLEVQEARESLAKVEATQNERRGKREGLEARLNVISEAQQQALASQPERTVTIEGAVATVYEVIRVPRGLEEAIAAALADQLEAFVFDRQGDAMAAVQALVDQKGPRVTALPLDGMKQVYPLNVLKERGVLGVAAKLVKCQPRYEKLMNALLGRTIIVQDSATAARLQKRGLGTLVTADGIVFHPSGAISGGQPQASRPFVLEYERDLETLPREMDRIQRSLEITGREADALRQRLRGAETALAALTREADEALDRRQKLQDAMGERQQKLSHFRGELRGLIGSQVALREQGRAYQQEADRVTQEREAQLGESKEAAETARQLSRADGLFKDRRKTLLKSVNEAADALAQVDGELRSLTAGRENAEAALARIEAQVNAKSVQLRGLEMEISTLDSTVGSDEAATAQARSQMETLLAGTEPEQEGARHLEARQRDLHSQVLAAQNRLFQAERRLLATEAEVRRWQSEMETLRVRMAEDGLVVSADGDILGERVETPPAVPFWLAADGAAEEGPGGLRPISGGAAVDREALRLEIEGLRARIRALGPVNVEAEVDYESLRERHDFLAGQVRDLEGAEQSLHHAIGELNGLMRKRFETTFLRVAEGFERNFQTFFGGGHARLRLTDPKDPGASGIEIEAQPPGKRTHSLTQLSGGEKALTAVSLLFALLQVNPSPFCVLDEVDAMLDEANVARFATALKELSQRTQFVVITHNRRTIEVADSIYGISMAPDAASRVLSMRLADVPAAAVEN
ncbi:MAG: chromosome segregation protein SMC [Dehalococcoidia bacterium]|nr:chromosome segregation protein SMC [Dehalococcoidia bacterium]